MIKLQSTGGFEAGKSSILHATPRLDGDIPCFTHATMFQQALASTKDRVLYVSLETSAEEVISHAG